MGVLKSFLILGTAVLIFSSCEDFLTITPTSAIVEEEFWQDKNDLENAVNGCYKSLTEENVLKRIIFWGELRSDNCDRSTNTQSTSDEANVMNANLLPTYNMFDWTPMYKTINYCNKVLAHGPTVIQNDESFTEQNWLPIKAEMITLRALCHFYLVRTFGEIPYVTVDYNNDSQDLELAQVSQLAVLDSIINDLESVKNIAMTEYGNTVGNKGRITKKAVYSLLADVYLWRASYKQGHCHPFINRAANEYFEAASNAPIVLPSDRKKYGTTAEQDYAKCVSYCNDVIQMSHDDLDKWIKKHDVGSAAIEILPCDLLAQHRTNTIIGKATSIENAYKELFGSSNADESIFELQFDGNSYGNKMVGACYFDVEKKTPTLLTAPTSLFEEISESPNEDVPSAVFTKTDYRRWEALEYEKTGQTAFNYSKFAKRSILQTNKTRPMLVDNTAATDNGTTRLDLTVTYRTNSNFDSNFIIYRLSEIYLMKAEAMAQIAEKEEDFTEAFNLVREVFKRSNPGAYDKECSPKQADSLRLATFTNKKSLELLVMAERQREFLCEGKRWFDLVRYSQRHGGTRDMFAMLCRKYSGNKKSIESKLADIQSLFAPVYEKELRTNSKLYQNGVWQKSKSTGRTDNL